MRTRESVELIRGSGGELIAVVAAGALHVGAELWFSEAVALWVSAALSAGFLIYLVARVRRHSGMLRAWGMRWDNFGEAIGPHLIFAAVGSAIVLWIGYVVGTISFPRTFWLTLLLYPIWGTAQQFALQNLLARNVYAFTSNMLVVSVVASILFGASHYPRLWLVALTAGAGFPFTIMYRRFPNLWAVGIAHGILGSLAVYSVLGEDPGAAILSALWRWLQGG
ncbi:MAG: CPBP family glutamic-type intramembrane protease [Gemmatimonadota bacterium]|nr:CPBP family glutamic-type intramembrane protease [Gemmatimonadota bacterium]